MLQMQLIERAYEAKIRLAQRPRLIVKRGAAKTESITLAHDRQRAVAVDHRLAPGRRKRPSAPDKKSRSIVSSPILACNSPMRRSSSALSSLAPLAKSSLACSSSEKIRSIIGLDLHRGP